MDENPRGLSFFTPTQIAVASFVGGPLPACILAGYNAKQLRESGQYLMWLIIGVAGTAAIIWLALFVLPSAFPPYILPIVYTIVLRESARNLQESGIEELQSAGAKQASWGIVTAAAVAGLVLMLGIVFALMQFFPRIGGGR